jgi:hypothetical protein
MFRELPLELGPPLRIPIGWSTSRSPVPPPSAAIVAMIGIVAGVDFSPKEHGPDGT